MSTDTDPAEQPAQADTTPLTEQEAESRQKHRQEQYQAAWRLQETRSYLERARKEKTAAQHSLDQAIVHARDVGLLADEVAILSGIPILYVNYLTEVRPPHAVPNPRPPGL